jgi:hypothetical protein
MISKMATQTIEATEIVGRWEKRRKKDCTGARPHNRHRRPNASVAEPRFQGNRCGLLGLNIKCDWDRKPCLRAGVSAAINKGRARQHSSRLIELQAVPLSFL